MFSFDCKDFLDQCGGGFLEGQRQQSLVTRDFGFLARARVLFPLSVRHGWLLRIVQLVEWCVGFHECDRDA